MEKFCIEKIVIFHRKKHVKLKVDRKTIALIAFLKRPTSKLAYWSVDFKQSKLKITKVFLHKRFLLYPCLIFRCFKAKKISGTTFFFNVVLKLPRTLKWVKFRTKSKFKSSPILSNHMSKDANWSIYCVSEDDLPENLFKKVFLNKGCFFIEINFK